jgi:hypothetical protein
MAHGQRRVTRQAVFPRGITGANAPGVPAQNYTGFVRHAKYRKRVVARQAVFPGPVIVPGGPLTTGKSFSVAARPHPIRRHARIVLPGPVVRPTTLAAVPRYMGFHVRARRPRTMGLAAPANRLGPYLTPPVLGVGLRIVFAPTYSLSVDFKPTYPLSVNFFPAS